MKSHYYKPQMEVVRMGGQQPLLNTSPASGMNVNMSGYSQGGNGSENSDGWSD